MLHKKDSEAQRKLNQELASLHDNRAFAMLHCASAIAGIKTPLLRLPQKYSKCVGATTTISVGSVFY